MFISIILHYTPPLVQRNTVHFTVSCWNSRIFAHRYLCNTALLRLKLHQVYCKCFPIFPQWISAPAPHVPCFFLPKWMSKGNKQSELFFILICSVKRKTRLVLLSQLCSHCWVWTPWQVQIFSLLYILWITSLNSSQITMECWFPSVKWTWMICPWFDVFLCILQKLLVSGISGLKLCSVTFMHSYKLIQTQSKIKSCIMNLHLHVVNT